MQKGMKEIKYLNENEIEVDGNIYSLLRSNDIFSYAGREWHILEKDERTVTVELVNKLSKEDMFKIFNKNLLDSDGDIIFNMKYDNIWWRDSVIRMGLNSKFLEMLNIDDLVEMETTVEYGGEKVTTRDYVRIVTKDEIESMSEKYKKMSNPNGSAFRWSLSPYIMYTSGNATVFYVGTSGDLNGTYVNSSGAVAPVIKLKTDCLSTIKNEN